MGLRSREQILVDARRLLRPRTFLTVDVSTGATGRADWATTNSRTNATPITRGPTS